MPWHRRCIEPCVRRYCRAFDTAGHRVRPVISPEHPEIKSLYRVYRRRDVSVKNAMTGDVARARAATGNWILECAAAAAGATRGPPRGRTK